jgi:hypothetical protein
MIWSELSACFVGGLFLANSVPHTVKGICGDRFPTPFAKPPGRGLSSPLVNVLWGLGNLAVGYELLRVGNLLGGCELHRWVFFAGVVLLAIPTSIHFASKEKE